MIVKNFLLLKTLETRLLKHVEGEFIAHAENCARADVALPTLTRNKQLLLIDKMH